MLFSHLLDVAQIPSLEQFTERTIAAHRHIVGADHGSAGQQGQGAAAKAPTASSRRGKVAPDEETYEQVVKKALRR